MNTEMDTNPDALDRSAGAVLLLAVAALSACATSNYDFDELSGVSGHARATHLGEALVQETERGRGGELYDMSMVPLARTHLNLFAEADEEGIPSGFVEADIDAYLPLFGFVDASVTRYDSDLELYEDHEFDSYLWGLFQSHRERVVTNLGLRETRTRRFLWLFSWRSSPSYLEAAHH